jgi:hypothetical protein
MKLIIDLEGLNLPGLDAEQAGLMVRDALGEFISARHPITDYVSERYRGQSDLFKKNKLAEVQKRVIWAAIIKAGRVSLEKP